MPENISLTYIDLRICWWWETSTPVCLFCSFVANLGYLLSLLCWAGNLISRKYFPENGLAAVAVWEFSVSFKHEIIFCEALNACSLPHLFIYLLKVIATFRIIVVIVESEIMFTLVNLAFKFFTILNININYQRK